MSTNMNYSPAFFSPAPEKKSTTSKKVNPPYPMGVVPGRGSVTSGLNYGPFGGVNPIAAAASKTITPGKPVVSTPSWLSGGSVKGIETQKSIMPLVGSMNIHNDGGGIAPFQPNTGQPAQSGGRSGGSGGTSTMNIIDQMYNDRMAGLQEQEDFANRTAEQNKQFLMDRERTGLAQTASQADVYRDQARRTFVDLQADTRRRARAAGGVMGSGFEELMGRLDSTLMQNLNDVNNQQFGIEENIKITTKEALSKIEEGLQKVIMSIAEDRRTSAREKSEMVLQARQSAARAASGVGNWNATASYNAQASQLLDYVNQVQAAGIPNEQKNNLINDAYAKFRVTAAQSGKGNSMKDIQDYLGFNQGPTAKDSMNAYNTQFGQLVKLGDTDAARNLYNDMWE
jgi:hypothetical protein